MRLISGLLLTAAVLTACGEVVPPKGQPADVCPESTISAAPVLAEVDLDGDGVAESVRVVGEGSNGCANVLVAQVNGKQVTAAATEPLPTVGKAVRLRSGGPDYLVTEFSHPRGGAQFHVFGYSGGELTEVKSAGQPLVPFVATDTGGAIHADCADGAIVTTVLGNVMGGRKIVISTFPLDGVTVGEVRRETRSDVSRKEAAKTFGRLGKNWSHCPS